MPIKKKANKVLSEKASYPDSIGITNHETLKFFSEQTLPQHSRNLQLAMVEQYQLKDELEIRKSDSRYAYSCRKMNELGFLDQAPTKFEDRISFTISPLGAEYLADVGKGVTLSRVRKKYSAQIKSSSPQSDLNFEPPQPIAPLNVSESTEKMMDSLSVVIKENAEYRALLMDIFNMIKARMNIQGEPENEA